MTKGSALIAARKQLGPAAHVQLRTTGVKNEPAYFDVGVYDLMGFRLIGTSSESWEQALEEAKRK